MRGIRGIAENLRAGILASAALSLASSTTHPLPGHHSQALTAPDAETPGERPSDTSFR